MGRRSGAVYLLAVCALTLAACRSLGPPAAEEQAAERQPPVAPRSATSRVVVAVIGSMESRNPYADSASLMYSVWCEVYGCLVAYDAASGDYRPALAESWAAENPTTWVFRLRKEARFGDGTPVTSADVVHSADQIMHHPASRQRQNVPAGTRFEAVDERTVRVVTRLPTASLLDYFADRLIITSKAQYERLADRLWEHKPVGAGLYSLKEFVPGQRIVLSKKSTWWGGPVAGPDEVVYRLVRDPEARVTALLGEEVQIAQDIPPDLEERVAASPGARIVPVESSEIMFLAMQPKPPFDKKEVRQAVAHAIDRDALIQTILKGQARRLDGPVGPGQYGYDPELAARLRYAYDPARARQLLAAAGYPDGVEVELSTPVGRYTQDRQLSEAMARMLTAAGIRTRLLTPEWSTLWDSIQKGKVPFYYIGRGGVVDPGRPLSQYFETGVSPRLGYSNPRLDALFKKERATFDPTERKRVLGEIFALITEEAPAHFLWRHKLLWGMSKRVDYTPPIHERLYAAEMRVR